MLKMFAYRILYFFVDFEEAVGSKPQLNLHRSRLHVHRVVLRQVSSCFNSFSGALFRLSLFLHALVSRTLKSLDQVITPDASWLAESSLRSGSSKLKFQLSFFSQFTINLQKNANFITK